MAIILAIFVSGCTAGTPSPSAQATIQPTPQPTSQVSVQPTAQPSQAPNDATVSIQNFAFSPGTVTILKGGTVIWTNNDSTAHTVTFADSGSPSLNHGDTYTKTFVESGTFDYHCSIHPSMTGKVIVQ
ncbi:MAG TPA: cupredoxin domain-containing protein [Methanocellaceae archaeon]